MMVQEGESTTQFVIQVEQARRVVNASSVSLYHAFVHKLDESVQLLLDNVCINKCTNGRSPVNWEDMVAICRDLQAGVFHMVANAVAMAAPGKPASAQVPTASASTV